MDPNVDTLAITRDAYHAYGDLREWKAYDGKPMPAFEELPDGIRDAWRAATVKAIESYARAIESTKPAEPAPVESPLEPSTG
jgi:hypothetical protein